MDANDDIDDMRRYGMTVCTMQQPRPSRRCAQRFFPPRRQPNLIDLAPINRTGNLHPAIDNSISRDDFDAARSKPRR